MLRRHSPGPWYVYRDAVHPNLDGKSPHETNADTIICEPLGPDRVANARLIAAAPELVACLRDLLALHEAHHNHPAHAAARATIKKAEGLS